MNILVQCPQLEYLDLDGIPVIPPDATVKIAAITLPQLAALKLARLKGITVSNVLNVLQAPNCSLYWFGLLDPTDPRWEDAPPPADTDSMDHCLAYITPRLTSALVSATRVELWSSYTGAWTELKIKADNSTDGADQPSFTFVGAHFDFQKLLIEWLPTILKSRATTGLGDGQSGPGPLPVSLQLEVGNGGFYREGIALLKRLPGIDKVHFGMQEGLDEVLEVLSAPQKLGAGEGIGPDDSELYQWVCPNLRKAKLFYCRILKAESLLRMVEARTNDRAMSEKGAAPAQLECVEIDARLLEKKISEVLRGALGGIALWT